MQSLVKLKKAKNKIMVGINTFFATIYLMGTQAFADITIDSDGGAIMTELRFKI